MQTKIDLATKEEVNEHKKEELPHQFTGSDNKIYKYGLKTNSTMDGLIFEYEEVL